MNYRFQNLLGAPYRGGNVVVSNNTHLISATGSRISVTNLIKSETTTFPFQSSSNISRIAVSPDGLFLVTIDDNSRCQLINVARRVVLHRITFKKPVSCLEFSPDGRYIGVGLGKLVQIWRSPGFSKSVFPFELVKTFANCNDKVTCIDWNYDIDECCYYLLVGSKDLTVRLLRFNEKTRFKNQDDKGNEKDEKGNKPFMFLGHRDVIVGAFFGVEQTSKKVKKVYTLSRDGAIFGWVYKGGVIKGGEPESPGTPERDMEVDHVGVGGGNVRKRKSLEGEGGMEKGKWELVKKDYFMQAPAKLTTCDYHKGLEMVVVGFSSGVFGLYQMPNFVCIHLLSISREKITTATFNDLGNWLTFGCAKLGQLLVWEWKSESYISKQQGHYFDVNTIAYSPDSQLLATGADDNKIKRENAVLKRRSRYDFSKAVLRFAKSYLKERFLTPLYIMGMKVQFMD